MSLYPKSPFFVIQLDEISCIACHRQTLITYDALIVGSGKGFYNLNVIRRFIFKCRDCSAVYIDVTQDYVNQMIGELHAHSKEDL